MGYDELLSSISCQRVIIIEDDFKQGVYKKERFMYDITRMALEDRGNYLEEIRLTDPATATAIQDFLDLFDPFFDSMGKWDDTIPRGDISAAFTILNRMDENTAKTIVAQYDALDETKLQAIYQIGNKFGLGIDHPAYFDSLYDEYFFRANRAKSIRIYSEFSAQIQQYFEDDIELATDDKSIVCIIDNYLEGANRAKEILNVICEKSKDGRKNIVGSIFSSRARFESVNNALYFEYTPKNTPELLRSSIAKSAYNYFISRLKTESIAGLQRAFDSAISNKGIAFYLSKRALKEGMSEYQVITDWIRLMSIPRKGDSSSIKKLIAISKVINLLDNPDDHPNESLMELNTLEAFDYTPNDYYLPVSSGDVFVDSNGHWFVLIGQDCDMARGAGRAPKNALAELLPAKIRNQTEFDKWANNLKTASIYSFRESLDSGAKVLQVDYTKREYISNEIINLCAYDINGKCTISLNKPLDRDKTKLMQGFMMDYYEQLQRYFNSIKQLNETTPSDFSYILANEFSPRLISVKDYELHENSLNYDLRRVCRLTHSYVFYLYKLYLEYRGRQPFQTINLIQQEERALPIWYNNTLSGLSIYIRFVPIPDRNNPKEWCWIIEKHELDGILQSLCGACVVEKADEIIVDAMFKEFPLNDHRKLKITRQKDKIDMQVQ